MRIYNLISTIAALIALGATDTGRCQDSFINLGFELANLPPVPQGQSGGIVSISDALPGWTGWLGSIQTSTVLHNDLALGTVNISVLGPN